MNLEYPHRRYNPLTGEWVLVSPHRTKRPWLGQVEKVPPPDLPEYDSSCYLCPGNSRKGGVQNPEYKTTFAFDNDFAALLTPEETPDLSLKEDDLFLAESETGVCRVICFSPKHNLTLPEMEVTDIRAVVDTWTQETVNLAQRDNIQYVQVFENKGAVMGCSNPHPHSQVWATSHIPNEPMIETYNQQKYREDHNSCMLCDYLEKERAARERIVVENDDFTALVPFWATWPFEILLIANKHVLDMPSLSDLQKSGLADIIQQITIKYDNLFETSFPYSMGFHGQPYDGKAHPEWHFHAHYYPPLLRSATVKKFMVGFEMLGMPQRDLTAESAASRLRELSGIHFSRQ